MPAARFSYVDRNGHTHLYTAPNDWVCDFCNESPVHWNYPVQTFEVEEIEWGSCDDWAVCNTCHELIVAGNDHGLLERSVQSAPVAMKPQLRQALQGLQDLFFIHRRGAPVPLDIVAEQSLFEEDPQAYFEHSH